MPNLHALAIDGLIQLIEIDFTAFGDAKRFYMDTTTYEGPTEAASTHTFQSNEYLPLPFQSGGFARGGENLVRPSLQIGDFSGALYEMLRDMNFAPGAPVTRKMVLKEDFASNNPYAVFQTENYVLNKVTKKGFVLDLELATHIDFQMRKFPNVTMIREDFPALNSALQF
mgnify:CR=1 FL=1